MDDKQANRIIKAIFAFGLFLVLLIVVLAVFLALIFDRTVRSMDQTNQRIDQLREIQKSSTVVPEIDYARIYQETDKYIEEKISKVAASIPKPNDGKDGISPEPVPGKDGKTPACYFEPNQCQGPRGIAGISPRQIEFDGAGHWKFKGDDEWLPLFKASTVGSNE